MLGLSACGTDQIAGILAAAQDAQYFPGDSVTIPGFRGANCGDRSTTFSGYYAESEPEEITFRLQVDGARLDGDYELCLSDRNGRATILILDNMQLGDYPAQLIAQDPTGTQVLVASWMMNVRERAPFALNSTGCGQAELDRVRTFVRDSVASQSHHEKGTTVIVPALLNASSNCALDEMFANYRRVGRDSSPDVRFSLHVTDPRTDGETASLGEDAFVNADNGKLLLKLDNLGRFDVTLQAESGPVRVDLLHWLMHVREGPGGADCGAHGDPDPADADLDAYGCVCTDEYTGANCEDPPATPQSASATPADSDDHTPLVVVLVLVLVMALVGGVVGYRYVTQRIKNAAPFDFDEVVAMLHLDGGDETNIEGGESVRVTPEELPRASVVLISELGHGEFGTVHKGLYTPPKRSTHTTVAEVLASRGSNALSNNVHHASFEYPVAVKALREEPSAQARQDFMREAAITAQFEHPNVVGLIGVVTKSEPSLLVLQFCEKGALDSLARDTQLPARQLLGFGSQVAQGMAYLLKRHFVHRDLAARNVLIDSKDEAKVADFGLSRDTAESSDYYTSTDATARMPLRWMAPEVFQSMRYGEGSDVWAFGVTMIELYSRAATPYEDWSNMFLCERVADGYILPCPSGCPQEVYDEVISPCFAPTSKERPTFAMLCQRFASLQALGWDADDDHDGPNAARSGRSRRVSFIPAKANAAEPPSLHVGGRVMVIGHTCLGTIRFVGDHHDDGSHTGPRIGVELDDPVGKNSGTVGGHGYFKCPAGHGLLVRPDRVALVQEHANEEEEDKEDDDVQGASTADADGYLTLGSMGRSSSNGSLKKPSKTMVDPAAALGEETIEGVPVTGLEARMLRLVSEDDSYDWLQAAKSRASIAPEEMELVNGIPMLPTEIELLEMLPEGKQEGIRTMAVARAPSFTDSAAAGGEERYLAVGATMAMSERFYVADAPGAPGGPPAATDTDGYLAPSTVARGSNSQSQPKPGVPLYAAPSDQGGYVPLSAATGNGNGNQRGGASQGLYSVTTTRAAAAPTRSEPSYVAVAVATGPAPAATAAATALYQPVADAQLQAAGAPAVDMGFGFDLPTSSGPGIVVADRAASEVTETEGFLSQYVTASAPPSGAGFGFGFDAPPSVPVTFSVSSRASETVVEVEAEAEFEI